MELSPELKSCGGNILINIKRLIRNIAEEVHQSAAKVGLKVSSPAHYGIVHSQARFQIIHHQHMFRNMECINSHRHRRRDIDNQSGMSSTNVSAEPCQWCQLRCIHFCCASPAIESSRRGAFVASSDLEMDSQASKSA